MELLLRSTIFLALGVWAAEGSEWSYIGEDGPDNWPSNFPTCGGSRQSPINIETGSVEVESWQPFTFENYEVLADVVRVENNGHSAQVEMEGGVAPIVRQGGLAGDYVFAQLHFHWGNDSAQGSEHTIDGVSYPLEMHIVNYKASYGNLTQAVTKPDGLAVLGVMFEIGETDNTALNLLVNTLSNITEAGMDAEVSSPYSLQAFLPDSTEKFYRYEGSLTTPTCNEAVIWTVFDTTVNISENQLAALRALETETGDKLVNNYRPPQALNNRTVSVSGVGNSGVSVSINKMGLALSFLSTMTLVMMNM